MLLNHDLTRKIVSEIEVEFKVVQSMVIIWGKLPIH